MIKFSHIMLLLAFSLLLGCVEIYNPDIELREGIIVVDARIVNGVDKNIVKVYKSLGFNQKNDNYPKVVGAKIVLVDDDENQFELLEIEDGTFLLNSELDETKNYKLRVEYQGDLYESEYEAVPDTPKLDSIYGLVEKVIIDFGEVPDINRINEVAGLMLYSDIRNKDTAKYYRYEAKKTFLYEYELEIGQDLISYFAWSTFRLRELYKNIAGPAKYSASPEIKKHPLFFIEERPAIEQEEIIAGGWILFLYQYSISENAFVFYEDINNQLQAEGRLFDPMFVQMRNNLKCLTDNNKPILGNFEIASHKEYRYYIRFLSDSLGYLIKPVPYFYNIPNEGVVEEFPPDFWETPSKKYPND